AGTKQPTRPISMTRLSPGLSPPLRSALATCGRARPPMPRRGFSITSLLQRAVRKFRNLPQQWPCSVRSPVLQDAGGGVIWKALEGGAEPGSSFFAPRVFHAARRLDGRSVAAG